MRLKAFISYSTADKQIAGEVKTFLGEYGVAAFLAHEDIHISQEWKNRIIQELSETNIFIPLLSKSFKESDWAPQEIGIAFIQKDMLFIPLSIDDTVPFGFVSHIQGKPIPSNGWYRDILIEPIITRFPHGIIPTIIERLREAESFLRAGALMVPLISNFDKFNDEEINGLVEASIDNDQVWNEHACRERYLPMFLKQHRSRIAPEKVKALEYQLTRRQRYPFPTA